MSRPDSPILKSTEPSEKCSILIVDDESFVREEIARILRLEDYEVSTAASGEAGLELLQRQVPQLIISDQKMDPGMSGTDFLSKVKACHPDVVTMVLSAYAEVDLVLDAVNRGGVHQYLLKPWSEADLLQRVDQALQFYRAQGEIRRLAQANQRLLKRLAAAEQFSLISQFSTALYDRFTPVLEIAYQEQAAQLGRSIGRSRGSAVHPPDRYEWFGLAGVVSRLGKLAALFQQGSKAWRGSVRQVIQQCVKQAEQAAKEVGLAVPFVVSVEPDLPDLSLQPDTFFCGMRALIENAILFGRDTGASGPASVAIRVSRVDDPDRAVRIEVQDNGPGIYASTDEIFAPLYSTCMQDCPSLGETKDLGGYNLGEYDHVGLGLPIARWCFMQHEAELLLANPGEPGACFRVDIPLERIDAATRAQPDTLPGAKAPVAEAMA